MGAQRDGLEDRGQDRGLPSTFQLFNAIIVIRWLSLAVASASYIRNLSTHELDFGRFIPALAVAIAYTLVLTLFPRRMYEFRMRGVVLLLVDFGVSFALLYLASGVWTPFFIFILCSAMMAGLRGTFTSGFVGAVSLSALYLLTFPIKGITYADLVAADSVALVIVYNIETMIFSVVWAYAAGLVVGFNRAVVRAADARDEVAAVNVHLDRHSRELHALHDVRDAVLNLLDLDEILRIVQQSLHDLGFEEACVVLSEDGEVPESTAATVVPVMVGDEILGAFLVERSGNGEEDPERQRLLELFAGQVALAVQHVRLLEEGQEYAVNDERNRIAIEIHDVVIQGVYGANLLAESVPNEDFDASATGVLESLRGAVGGSLRNLRIAVLNWDSMGWELSLLPMVDRYLEEFRELSGLGVFLVFYGADRDMQPTKRKDLLAILQEALSNAWRHADADTVTVALAFEGDVVCLSVRDDGSGFDTTADRDRWVGLKTIYERSERHGAGVHLASSPGCGTEFRVVMPW